MNAFQKNRLFVYSFVFAFLLIQYEACYAQLIGNRTVGAPIGTPSARQQPGVGVSNIGGGSAVPGAQGGGIALSPAVNGRFVRGNRSRNDFVGSNRTDQQGFVGATQAIGVGRVQSAAETLRIARDRTGNRPVPLQPASGMYYPRLEFDENFFNDTFSVDTAERTKDDESEPPLQTIQNRMTRIAGNEISLEMVGRLAIVRGQVDSKRQADLLVSLLRFEPGIDEVRSEVIVAKKR